MRTTISIAALCWALLAGPATGSAAVSQDPHADAMAAESLYQSARAMVYAPADTPARAGRMVALAGFARKLTPEEAGINKLFSNIIDASQGNLAAAARAAQAYLADFPADHKQGLLWLNMSLDTLNKADERIAFLRSVVGRKDLPSPLRAEAAALLAKIRHGRGERAKSIETFDLALRLDRYNSTALNGRMSLKNAPTPQDKADTLLALIRGNPTDTAMASELAALLDSLGLHAEAVRFFAYAWDVAIVMEGPQQRWQPFAAPYLNALLSAGRFQKAVDVFQPMLEGQPEGIDLRPLVAEAYRQLGRDKEADQLTKHMAQDYDAKVVTASTSPTLAAQLAWFNLMMQNRPRTALKYAQLAARSNRDHPVVRLVLAAAQLKVGNSAEGEKGLKELLDSDMYSAVFLAEYYFANDKAQAAREAIAAGASLGRNGSAFRRLAKLATRHDITLAPAEGAKEVAEAVGAFDRRYLLMAQAPEDFITISVRPVKGRFVPGEPVEIEAVLANKGDVDVPLGSRGLISPTMSLKVTVAGRENAVFSNLPLVVWPAPRYLQPGQSVSTRTRIDVGRLGQFLFDLPLSEIELKVTATLDPIQYGDTFRSALPTVQLDQATLLRGDLLGDFDRTKPDAWPNAYNRALGLIVRDMKRGTLPQRMLAARQVASLLALANQPATLPKALRNAVTRPVLLSMLRAVLQDPSAVVRAEMLASLENVRLDKRTISLLAPAIEDPSALVRFRLVELLGSCGLPGQDTIVNYLSQDSDPLVKMMASSFGKASQPAAR